MTSPLDQGIDAVRKLSPERQNAVGELLLTIARQADGSIRLTDEQVAEVNLAIAEADAGDYATEEEMRHVWPRSR